MRPTTEDLLVKSVWDESTKSTRLVRVPVRTVLGPNDVSDLRPRALTSIWRNALVPSYYSVARDLSRWPDRLTDGRKPVASTDGIGTTMAKSFASKRAQEAYALRAELGDRAYAELTGTKPKARKTRAKASRPTPAPAERPKLDGTRPVVLSDHDLMAQLGIRPIGYLD